MTKVAQDLAQASVLLDLKRYDEAASLLARIVAVEPDDSQAWCLFAATHLGAGRYKEAAAAASRAITLAPSDDWPYRLASIAQRHLGKITAAISSANEACKLAPNEWQAYICLAQAQLATEVDFDAAERAAADALRLAPYEPDAHFTAGQVSYAREKWKAARAHQERALALDPAHSNALNELGRISLHRGGHRQAARHFIQATRSAPGVSAYGRNVEVPIGRVLARTVSTSWIATLALLYLTLETRVSRGAIVLGYALAISLAAGYGMVQLWRMPPEMRLLFRTGRVALALGTIYGAILTELTTAAVTPARALPAAMLSATALIVASAFVARASLRSKNGR
ncbi:MAG TPA: tetratricopeptide repeat protein [Chloroflexota bacterium]